jgi:hypothetical protein
VVKTLNCRQTLRDSSLSTYSNAVLAIKRNTRHPLSLLPSVHDTEGTNVLNYPSVAFSDDPHSALNLTLLGERTRLYYTYSRLQVADWRLKAPLLLCIDFQFTVHYYTVHAFGYVRIYVAGGNRTGTSRKPIVLSPPPPRAHLARHGASRPQLQVGIHT